MRADEAEAFENDPLFDISIRMRKWDELAKETHIPITDIRELKKKAQAVLSQ
jgi:predicted HD phosphohydrolase